MAPTRRSSPGRLACALTGLALALSPAASAGEDEPRPRDWSETELGRIIERQLDRAFDRLKETLDELPRYALPEITEEGDIIIRRLPRRREDWPPAAEDPEAVIDL